MATQVKVIEMYESFIEGREAGVFVDRKTGKERPYAARESYMAKVVLVETTDMLKTRINFRIPKDYPKDVNVGDILMVESYQLDQLNKQFDLKSIFRHNLAK